MAGGERGRGFREKEAQMVAQRPLRRKESRVDCQERAKCQEKGRDWEWGVGREGGL